MSTPADGGPSGPSATTARAGLAGAGCGTGLVVLAQSLPEDTTLKAILVYGAPTVSILLGSLVYFIELQTSRYLQQRLARRVRRTLEEYLQNPHTSESHKAALRKRLEHLEDIVTLQEVERVRVIGLVQPPQTTQDSA